MSAVTTTTKAIANKAKNDKYISIAIAIAILLAVGVGIYFVLKSTIMKGKNSAAFNNAGTAGTPEFYAKKIFDAGSGDWWDWSKWNFDEDAVLNTACQIGRDRIYTDVIRAFRTLYERELADYLAKGLDSDELMIFDDRATGKVSC